MIESTLVSASPNSPNLDNAREDPRDSEETQVVFDDVGAGDCSVEPFYKRDFGLARPEVGDMCPGQDTNGNRDSIENEFDNGGLR